MRAYRERRRDRKQAAAPARSSPARTAPDAAQPVVLSPQAAAIIARCREARLKAEVLLLLLGAKGVALSVGQRFSILSCDHVERIEEALCRAAAPAPVSGEVWPELADPADTLTQESFGRLKGDVAAAYHMLLPICLSRPEELLPALPALRALHDKSGETIAKCLEQIHQLECRRPGERIALDECRSLLRKYVIPRLDELEPIASSFQEAEGAGGASAQYHALHWALDLYRLALRRVHVVPMDARPGRRFEDDLHQDQGQVSPPASGSIAKVHRQGYLLGGHVLRKARVEIARAG